MKLNLKYINIILLIIIILLVVCMMIKKEHYKSNCNKNNRPSHNLSKNNNNHNNNGLFAYTNNHGRNVYTNPSIERFSYNYKLLSSLCGTTHSIDCGSPDNTKSDDYYNNKFTEIMSANREEIEKHMLNIANNATEADKTIEEYETTAEGETDILKLLCFLAGKSDCCKDKTDTYNKCVSMVENNYNNYRTIIEQLSII